MTAGEVDKDGEETHPAAAMVSAQRAVHPDPCHILEFTAKAIRLCDLSGRVIAETEIGSDGGPVDTGMLQGAARPDDDTSALEAPIKVVLWLPEDQLAVVTERLPSDGEARLAAARAAAVTRTGHKAEDLAIAIATKDRADGCATVFASFTDTVSEARAYAASWGFEASTVASRAMAAAAGTTDLGLALPGAAPADEGDGTPPTSLAISAPAPSMGTAFLIAERSASVAPVEQQLPAEHGTALRLLAAGVVVLLLGIGLATGGYDTLRQSYSEGQRAAAVAALPLPQRPAPPAGPAAPTIMAGPPVEAQSDPAPRPLKTAPGRLAAVTGPDPDPLPVLAKLAATVEPAASAPAGTDEPAQAAGLTAFAMPVMLDAEMALIPPTALVTANIAPAPAQPPIEATPPSLARGPAEGTPANAPSTASNVVLPVPRPANPDSADAEEAPAAEDSATLVEAAEDGDDASALATDSAPSPTARPAGLGAAPAGTTPAPPPRSAIAALEASRLRETFEAESEAMGAATSPADDATLIGVLFLDGQRQALMRLANGTYHRVGIGDRIGDWTISEIEDEAVTLSADGETRNYPLVSR
ncbi:MAG: hypothetical protein AAFT19_06455 [Pseudomonadota bacterium]